MILTERETARGTLVTVCDDDALGETYENGDVSLDVTEEFYGGEAADAETVAAALSGASVANLVGTNSVQFAIEEGFVEEDKVLELDGTLHAQFLRL